MRKLLIAGLLIGLATGAHAAPGDETRELDGWTIVTRPQPDEKISPSCILRGPAVDGGYFQMTNPENIPSKGAGNARVNFYVPGSAPITGGSGEVKIDGMVWWTPTVEVVEAGPLKAIATTLSNDVREVFPPFSKGRTLTVTANAREFNFPLTGSLRAFDAYKECLSKVRIKQ